MTQSKLDTLPKDRHYDGETHIWVQLDPGNGEATVGLDAFSLESLGELAYISLHDIGTTVTRGEPIGTLEAAKMTSPLLAPISGKVIRRNESVLKDPLQVNASPYDQGWLVVLEPTNWGPEAAALISGEAIDPWAKAEKQRAQDDLG